MPLPLQIICILLFAIALLIVVALSLRLTLTIEYDKGLKVYIQALFIKIKLYPFPKKRKKHRVRHVSAAKARRIRRAAERKAERRLFKIKSKKKKKAQGSDEKKEEKKSEFKLPTKDQINLIIDILKLVTEISAVTVRQFAKRLRIKTARLKVKVATPDPAVTAIAYGAVTQTVNILLPILYDVKNFKIPSRKNFNVWADFTTDRPEFDLKISFSLRVWHLLDIPIAGVKRAAPELPKYINLITQILSPKKEDEEEKKDPQEKTDRSEGTNDPAS